MILCAVQGASAATLRLNWDLMLAYGQDLSATGKTNQTQVVRVGDVALPDEGTLMAARLLVGS